MEQLDREMDELDINYALEFQNLADSIGSDMFGERGKAEGAAASADSTEPKEK